MSHNEGCCGKNNECGKGEKTRNDECCRGEDHKNDCCGGKDGEHQSGGCGNHGRN